MSLKERLQADLREAIRTRDELRKSAIRMLRAAIVNAEIAWQREATDQQVQQLIVQEIKQRREAIEYFQRGGRDDLVRVEEQSIRLLQAYLPEQLSREQVVEAVQRIVAELGAARPKDLGPVMRRAMAELQGRADGRLVNEVAREALQGE